MLAGARALVTLISSKVEWPYDLVLGLIAHANSGIEMSHEFVDKLRSFTTLLPPGAVAPLTRTALRALVPRAEEPMSWSDEARATLASQRGSAKPDWSDGVMVTIWPVRAKADLGIRRTRLSDCYDTYVRGHATAEFWRIAERLPGFDLITAVNILTAHWWLSTTSWSWFDWWDGLGAWTGGTFHFAAVAKEVSDLVKKYESADAPALRVVECAGLTGYRLPPIPGFDVVRETRALAEGGGRHGLTDVGRGLEQFRKIAETVLDTPGEAVEWESFESFVRRGAWETAGSALIPGIDTRVEWQFGDDEGKFKPRKNVVPDVVPMDELLSKARLATGQTNVSIVKSELGKLRMAVSSDMYTYLKMSWITQRMGRSYLRWRGNTIEEDAVTQTDRMIEMLAAVCKRWNLPFDYKLFDHQPTTAELQVIVDIIGRCARRNVPRDGLAEFDALLAEVRASFDHSTLSVRDTDGVIRTFPVTGGVMSGLRWTTILGFAWNTVMTCWVLSLLDYFQIPIHEIEFWIRGDDTELAVPDYATALAAREFYAAIGAEGSDGKFYIKKAKSDFLRIVYSPEGCRGYPARAIPGLTQRKPWSAAPWTEEAVMLHLRDTFRTLLRRGCDPARAQIWWSAAASAWAQRRHASTRWLQLPVPLGGLGVEPWDCATVADERWPRVDVGAIRVKNSTPWRSERISEQLPPALMATRTECDELAARLLSAKISGDDIPAVGKALRAAAKPAPPARWRRVEFEWRAPVVRELLALRAHLSAVPVAVGSFQSFLDLYPAASPWGTNARLLPAWRDVASLARVRSVKPGSLMRVIHPEFFDAVTQLERRGLVRWEAIAWTTADYPFPPLKILHPALTGLLQQVTVYFVNGFLARSRVTKSAFHHLVASVAYALEEALHSSPLARVVYSW